VRGLLASQFGLRAFAVRNASSEVSDMLPVIALSRSPAMASTGIYAGVAVGACVLGGLMVFGVMMVVMRRRQRSREVRRVRSRRGACVSSSPPLSRCVCDNSVCVL
jgi:uncharacterized oligopeptide transporter (OPT) family protein